MFIPNLIGQIRTKGGWDLHGRASLSEAKPCPFGPINLNIGAIKTSVRADSSASRGSADQEAAEKASILIPSTSPVSIGDVFSFKGVDFEITAVHERYSVGGNFDHYECEMEIHLG